MNDIKLMTLRKLARKAKAQAEAETESLLESDLREAEALAILEGGSRRTEVLFGDTPRDYTSEQREKIRKFEAATIGDTLQNESTFRRNNTVDEVVWERRSTLRERILDIWYRVWR